jgi:hypothetical protein
LSLSSASMGGTVSEISPPVGVMLPAPVLLWDASLSSDKDEDDGSVLDTVDVRHVEKVPAEPCDDLLAAALGDNEGWVQVGRGSRHGREPSALFRKEGLEGTLAFKRWAQGRYFRCLERGHQVSMCRGPYRCIRCRRHGHREHFCHAMPSCSSFSLSEHSCSFFGRLFSLSAEPLSICSASSSLVVPELG